MRVKLLFSLLLSVSLSAQTPVDYAKWQINDTTFSANIGGPVHNYKYGAGWAAIQNDYVAEGDSILKAENAVLKTRVNKNTGKVSINITHEGRTFAISQRLIGIAWLNMSTGGDPVWIDKTMNWNNDSRDSTYVHWNNVSPGVNYGVRKGLGSVEHGIIFKPAFLDSAITLYNQRTDTLKIGLANVMEYTLSVNIDNADSALGRVNKRELKAIGRRAFELTKQRVHVAGQTWTKENPEPYVKVEQFWKRIGDKMYCVEFVPMHDIKKLHEDYPTKNIWHNATADVSDGNCEVAGGISVTAAHNTGFGASDPIEIWVNGPLWIISRAVGVATALGVGATISACYLRFKVETNWTGGTVTAYPVLKPWIEGISGALADGTGAGCNGSRFDNAASKEWNGWGASCANDDGVYNSVDGDGATCTSSTHRDRKATAAGTTSSYSATDDSISISTTLAQAWYAGTANEEGVQIIPSASHDQNWYTDDNGTAGNRPHWHFVYTTAAAGGTPNKRRMIMQGAKK